MKTIPTTISVRVVLITILILTGLYLLDVPNQFSNPRYSPDSVTAILAITSLLAFIFSIVGLVALHKLRKFASEQLLDEVPSATIERN
jgi:hypothetical protein